MLDEALKGDGRTGYSTGDYDDAVEGSRVASYYTTQVDYFVSGTGTPPTPRCTTRAPRTSVAT